MKQEHEQKMAELFQREEEAKKQVEIIKNFFFFLKIIFIQVATWEQMYREWMATMERRVNNLQMTNEELQVKYSTIKISEKSLLTSFLFFFLLILKKTKTKRFG